MTQETTQSPKITISDDGHLCYQPLASNPLPGDVVAKLVKGDTLFTPAFVRSEDAPISEEEIKTGLQTYLAETLSVFTKLIAVNEENPVAEPVKIICAALYDAAGMLARDVVQEQLSGLDTDMRAQLRSKGVRLGPLFIYSPEMNKPAALRVRAVLWGLFNSMELPVTRVPDGVVSKRVETMEAPISEEQKELYKALCYPVYGGRVIRIDMLDRVVNAIYETADKGRFKAQHSMAEWLGCPISDLYDVLTSLGHKKTYDPAEEAEKLSTVTETETETAIAEDPVSAEAVPTPETPAQDVETESVAEGDTASDQAKTNVKPVLATFALKRGQAHKSTETKKPFRKPNEKKASSTQTKKKPNKKNSNKAQKPRDNGPRVFSSGPEKPSLANSPFAALSQLKK